PRRHRRLPAGRRSVFGPRALQLRPGGPARRRLPDEPCGPKPAWATRCLPRTWLVPVSWHGGPCLRGELVRIGAGVSPPPLVDVGLAPLRLVIARPVRRCPGRAHRRRLASRGGVGSPCHLKRGNPRRLAFGLVGSKLASHRVLCCPRRL